MLVRFAPRIVGVTALNAVVSHSRQQRSLPDKKSELVPLWWTNRKLPSSLVSYCDSDMGFKVRFKWRPDVTVGDAEANYKVALQYFDAKHPNHNVNKGFDALKLAADQGHIIAQFELASIYYNTKHFKDAATYFKLAADQGHSKSQHIIGTMYFNGDGVKRDKTEAERYYQLAAVQGEPNALHNLGLSRLQEALESKDDSVMQLAADYIIRAADMGHKIAQNDAGGCYVRGTGVAVDKQKALAYFKQSAEQGWLSAQYNVGSMFYHGDGVPQDLDEALRHYKMAADKGYLFAQFWAADALEQLAARAGVKSTEAVHYFKLAADQGHRYSAYKVAGYKLMHDSEGNIVDMDEGLRYLYFALGHGEPAAQPLLAFCHWHGVGMEKDRAEGLRILLEAAEHGNSMAYKLLAHFYQSGEEGVPQSAEETQKYSDLIAAQQKQGTYMYVNAQEPTFWKLYKW